MTDVRVLSSQQRQPFRNLQQIALRAAHLHALCTLELPVGCRHALIHVESANTTQQGTSFRETPSFWKFLHAASTRAESACPCPRRAHDDAVSAALGGLFGVGALPGRWRALAPPGVGCAAAALAVRAIHPRRALAQGMYHPADLLCASLCVRMTTHPDMHCHSTLHVLCPAGMLTRPCKQFPAAASLTPATCECARPGVSQSACGAAFMH